MNDLLQITLLYSVILYVILILIICYLTRKRDTFKNFLLTLKKDYQKLMIGFIIFFVLNVVFSSISDILVPNTNANQNDIKLLLNSSYILTFSFVVILAPLLEELLFRKVLFYALAQGKGLFKFIKKGNRFFSYLLTTLLFAYLHIATQIGVDSWYVVAINSLPYVFACIYLNYIYEKFGSIYASMSYHIISNLIVLLLFL